MEQAKKLEPRYLRWLFLPDGWPADWDWMSSAQTMLSDRVFGQLVDYPNAAEVFPGVELKVGSATSSGIATHDGACSVTTVRRDEVNWSDYRASSMNSTSWCGTAVRFTILRKVLARKEASINTILARRQGIWLGHRTSTAFTTREQARAMSTLRSSGRRSVAWISRARRDEERRI